MNSVIESNAAPSNDVIKTARSLRILYFTRVAFSLLWIILVVTLSKTNSVLATVLFIIYPAWDVIATIFDIRANAATVDKTAQYINIVIGILTTIAVILALQKNVPSALMVFGVWAFLAGLIQLILGLRRRNKLEGQWPMIISGGQSMLAGIFIFANAHIPDQGVDTLAGYSAFGAFYFLLAAFRLGKTIRKAAVAA